MITVVSGKLGSGKSFDCVRRMMEHLNHGGVVATNIKLDLRRLSDRLKRRLQSFQILQISPLSDPKTIPIGDRRGRGTRRVMVVLDEALNWFQSTQDRSKSELEKKAMWGEWLRQSDKLGQDVYFIAQNFERAAKWIRELAQLAIEIVPLREVRFLHIPIMRVIPFASRLYIRKTFDVRSEACIDWAFDFYSRYVWEMYDTSETFGFESADTAFRYSIAPRFSLPLRFFWLPVIVLFYQLLKFNL